MKLPGLIIGAGIGGVALAIALRNAGIDSMLFEQSPEPRESGAGLTVWANALQAIDRLGLRQKYDQISCQTDASLYDSNGKLLMQGASLPDEFDPIATVVHRAELLDMLVHAYGKDAIKYGARCIGIEQKNGRVVASFDNGTSAEGAFLVGADGLHSVVRTHLFGSDKPVYAGYTAWRAVVDCRLGEENPGERWGAAGRFGYIPMTRGRTMWFATCDVDERSHTVDGEKKMLLQLFGNWHQPIKELIETTPESAILRNNVYDRAPVKTWTKGVITLLGDAAHPITPVLGQGACLALEDAVVLAQCLKENERADKALLAYENKRLERANFFVKHARMVSRIGQLRSPLLIAVRNVLLRSVLASVEPKIVRQMLTVEL